MGRRRAARTFDSGVGGGGDQEENATGHRSVCVGSVCAAAVLAGVSFGAPGDLSYELFGPSPSAETEFGNDVAIDGDLLIVGQQRDDTVGNNAGRVHF